MLAPLISAALGFWACSAMPEQSPTQFVSPWVFHCCLVSRTVIPCAACVFWPSGVVILQGCRSASLWPFLRVRQLPRPFGHFALCGTDVCCRVLVGLVGFPGLSRWADWFCCLGFVVRVFSFFPPCWALRPWCIFPSPSSLWLPKLRFCLLVLPTCVVVWVSFVRSGVGGSAPGLSGALVLKDAVAFFPPTSTLFLAIVLFPALWQNCSGFSCLPGGVTLVRVTCLLWGGRGVSGAWVSRRGV